MIYTQTEGFPWWKTKTEEEKDVKFSGVFTIFYRGKDNEKIRRRIYISLCLILSLWGVGDRVTQCASYFGLKD